MKLSEEDKWEIIRLNKEGISQNHIAKMCNIRVIYNKIALMMAF